ncbi:UDP-N-acetylmuramoyl-tripeptide--D-alanyl-D-alanine ligase [Spongiivirga citrea]|uniref:UDP-N-acetylmuramoyl-tripeptide--D-alanyl-D-alanine ligase n=1 Tax=Spongiivirga citrea TaxID=1481457 RepID=A0A6M0CNY8_9FLAO|nr:UDP-N-acetylmuramoyl-tripeptide--D-alanyl-D-alanine ligase [Spongiivirga citrea]NER18663.1 UDP-N-acetylmuramoyl-tripeptide--D-alanyl-D-alanine ligase [Spongiivirga citrea]
MTIERLHHIFLDSTGVSTDTRNIEKGQLFFALKGDNFNGNAFAEQALTDGAAYCVIDEEKYNTNSSFTLVDDVLTALQKLATYHREFLKIPILALTGSNGKTTTKELIAVVLSQKFNVTSTKGNLNNHIGVPLTLLSMNKETEFGVVEMGANHQKEIEFLCEIAKPDYGYITNFGKAHLEGFGGFEGVIKGKSELLHYINENGKDFFYNADDALMSEKVIAQNTFSFSEKKGANCMVKMKEANPLVQITFDGIDINSHLIGSYNFTNIAAAIAIGQYFKVDTPAIKNAIENYIPSNNRSQLIKKGNNTVILDAYNANPTSMKAALDNLSNLKEIKKLAILGDMFEVGETSAQEHQAIHDLSSSLNFDQVYLVGNAFAAVKSANNDIHIFSDFDALKDSFVKPDNATILIKGSRGMKLERVLELL